MLGLRRFWSQSIRLTWRTAISQRPSRLDEAVAAPARQIARAVHAEFADQEIGAHHARVVARRRRPRRSRSCAPCATSAPATRHSRCAAGRCGPPCGGGRRTRSRSRAADRRRSACPAPSRCIRACTSRASRSKSSWSSSRASRSTSMRKRSRSAASSTARSSRCQSVKSSTSSLIERLGDVVRGERRIADGLHRCLDTLGSVRPRESGDPATCLRRQR